MRVQQANRVGAARVQWVRIKQGFRRPPGSKIWFFMVQKSHFYGFLWSSKTRFYGFLWSNFYRYLKNILVFVAYTGIPPLPLTKPAI